MVIQKKRFILFMPYGYCLRLMSDFIRERQNKRGEFEQLVIYSTLFVISCVVYEQKQTRKN